MPIDAIAIDFETFYSKKLKHTLTTQIAEEYCNSPHFDPYLVAVCDGKQSWAGNLRDFNWNALHGKTLASHNAYFERTVFKRLKELGRVSPTIIPGPWFCTANMTSYLCNRRSLDQAMELLLGVKVSKEVRAKAEGRHWPDDFTLQERSDMMKYGRADAFECWTLLDRYLSFWPELERRLSEMTIAQGMRGVQIDRPLLDTQIVQVHEMLETAKGTIPWIAEADDESWEEFGDSATKPTSTKCMAEQCKRSGIPCCPVKSDDEEKYVEWETTYGPRFPWIGALSAWRSINKHYKTLLLVKKRLRPDGTLPFATKYFGAHTGRWSGDARINMQNMRKKPVICTQEGFMAVDEKKINAAMDEEHTTSKWPSWVKYALDFRHLFVPRPGMKMIASDLSQIEPRVLAWLSGDTAMLNSLSTGMSVYQSHACASMGWTGGDLKNENPDMYKLAKARVLALGYQAGWAKFIEMAYDLARLDITKDDPEFETVVNPFTGVAKQVSGYGAYARQIVAEFRKQNPKIKGLWDRLDDGFKRSIGGDFVLRLPSGRKMVYRKVRCESRIVLDPETKQPRKKTVFTADIGGIRKQCYGGLLTENLVQATAREVFVEHLIKLEDAGFTNLFSVHDEAIVECPLNRTAEEVSEIMSFCPEWLRGCYIRAEAKEIPHYLK